MPTSSATPTPTAEGVIQWDSDDNRIAVGDGATTTVFYSGAHTADQVGTVNNGDFCQGGAGSVLDCDVTQNAGTNIANDLEEETHASEHAENAADELLGEALGTACTDGQVLKADATGGLVCGTDNSGGGGSPVILDLGDDGGNDSTDLTEIAITGDKT